MKQVDFIKGELLFIEGSPSEMLYLIESGSVRLTVQATGGDVAHLRTGDLVGDIDTLVGRPRTTTARAASEVRTWGLSSSDLIEVISADPRLGLKLSFALGERVQATEGYLVSERLSKVPLFASLSPEELVAVAKRLQPQSATRGEILFRPGEPAKALYVIEDGKVRLTSAAAEGEGPSTVLSDGATFGEMALLASRTHTATAQALVNTVLWALQQSDFAELLTQFPAIKPALSRALSEPLTPLERSLAERQLKDIALFAGLPIEVLRDLVGRLMLRHFPQGESVYTLGSPSEGMYFVESGEIELASNGTPIDHLKAGRFFGELTLLNGGPRQETARALADTNLWALYRPDVENWLRAYPIARTTLEQALNRRTAERVSQREAVTRLGGFPLFSGLTQADLADILHRLQTARYLAGEVIVEAGSPGKMMFFIESGQVRLSRLSGRKSISLPPLKEADFFGDSVLLSGRPYAWTARAVTDASLLALDRAGLESLLLTYPSVALVLSRTLGLRLEEVVLSAADTLIAPSVAAQVRTTVVAQRPVPRIRPMEKALQDSIAMAVREAQLGLSEMVLWYGERSTAARLRLATVAALMAWFFGMSLPAMFISALPVRAGDVAIALLTTPTPPAITPTLTPTPEDTPTPTLIPTPTAIPPTPVPKPVVRAPVAAPQPAAPQPTAGPTARPEPGLEVYDMNGSQQDLAWAAHWYGTRIERAPAPGPGGAVFRVVSLQEQEGPAAITVWVFDENNQPIVGADVMVNSPGGRQDSDKTKADGEWAFAMGRGSYLEHYGYEGGVGPHDIYVSYQGYPSDKVVGLGMLGGTNHRHLNVSFKLYKP
jgi:CRP-like cAMP-binding protein